MSNTLFDNARKLMLEGGLDWANNSTCTINVYLLSAAYSLDVVNHSYLTSVGTGRVAGPQPITGRVTLGGAANGNSVTFPSVSGAQVTRIIIVKNGPSWPTESDSPLIANIDSATGLPITPNTGDIIVTWDTGTNKIFRP
jgi:hypothetical protein